jgi:hypothetical protein
MTEREQRRGDLEGRGVNPPVLAPTNPPPFAASADYSLATLQTVMDMQQTLGQLKQAVVTLTDQQKEHTTKLDAIGKDVHTGKVALRVIGVVAVGLGGLLAWILARAWDVILKSYIPGVHS